MIGRRSLTADATARLGGNASHVVLAVAGRQEFDTKGSVFRDRVIHSSLFCAYIVLRTRFSGWRAEPILVQAVTVSDDELGCLCQLRRLILECRAEGQRAFSLRLASCALRVEARIVSAALLAATNRRAAIQVIKRNPAPPS
jgi:hypothetical protein